MKFEIHISNPFGRAARVARVKHFATEALVAKKRAILFAVAERETDNTFTLTSVMGQYVEAYLDEYRDAYTSLSIVEPSIRPLYDRPERGDLGKGLTFEEAYARSEVFYRLISEHLRNYAHIRAYTPVLRELKWANMGECPSHLNLYDGRYLSHRKRRKAHKTINQEEFAGKVKAIITRTECFADVLPSPVEDKVLRSDENNLRAMPHYLPTTPGGGWRINYRYWLLPGPLQIRQRDVEVEGQAFHRRIALIADSGV